MPGMTGKKSKKLQPVNFNERSPEIKLAIENNYRKATTAEYPYSGDSPSYLFSNNIIRFCTDVILESVIQKKLVLDIGAGNGGFIRGNNEKYPNSSTYGITASFSGESKNMMEGNCEDLFNQKNIKPKNYIEPNKFDVIVSSKTLMHVCDPIGLLMQAYLALKVGGILIVDGFRIRGCEYTWNDVFEHLKKNGYKIFHQEPTYEGKGEFAVSGFVVIKKNKPELNFPLAYSHISKEQDRVFYQPIDLKPQKKIINNNSKIFELSYAESKPIQDWAEKNSNNKELKEVVALLMKDPTVKLNKQSIFKTLSTKNQVRLLSIQQDYLKFKKPIDKHKNFVIKEFNKLGINITASQLETKNDSRLDILYKYLGIEAENAIKNASPIDSTFFGVTGVSSNRYLYEGLFGNLAMSPMQTTKDLKEEIEDLDLTKNSIKSLY